MQSLQLWREIQVRFRDRACLSCVGVRLHALLTRFVFVALQNQMFRLWMAADKDLLEQTRPYRLYNTGQGLHRVQSAPHVSNAMHDILGTVKSRSGGW